MNSQSIICDLGTKKATAIHYVQGEKGRTLVFSFINSLLEDMEVRLSGYTVDIHILKSDGNFTVAHCTVVGNTATYTLTENDCIVGGAGVFDLSLSRNGELIYTAHGDYVGDNRAISDDIVNSVSTAYGVTFPDGFQEKLTAGDNITIVDNVISASGEQSFNYNNATNKPRINGVELTENKTTSDLHIEIPEYTAGENVTISNGVISATDTTYTAGENVTIENGVISATDTTYTAGDNITIQNGVISASGGGSVEYSTDERVIGTWVDGTDVYEKTFIISPVIHTDGNAWVDTGCVLANLGNIIEYHIICRDTYVGNAPANSSNTSFRYNNNNIQLYVNSAWYLDLQAIVIRYTKTV